MFLTRRKPRKRKREIMNEEILSSLKSLLPSADESVLEFVVEAVSDAILNYINHDTLPKELKTAAVLICKAYYHKSGFDGSTADVTAVKRGDVQTNFGAEKTAVSLDGNSDFFGYRAMLAPFRKVRW